MRIEELLSRSRNYTNSIALQSLAKRAVPSKRTHNANLLNAMLFRVSSHKLISAVILLLLQIVPIRRVYSFVENLRDETIEHRYGRTTEAASFEPYPEISSQLGLRQDLQCHSAFVCPDCSVIGYSMATALMYGVCSGVTQRSDGCVDCNGSCLGAETVGWLLQGQCYDMCTLEAAMLCHRHRNLLQASKR